jgi:hypothetical protein
LFRAWLFGLQSKRSFIPAVSSICHRLSFIAGPKKPLGLEAVKPADHHNGNLPQATETSNSSTVARQ